MSKNLEKTVKNIENMSKMSKKHEKTSQKYRQIVKNIEKL